MSSETSYSPLSHVQDDTAKKTQGGELGTLKSEFSAKMKHDWS